jgi:Tol biopolymer transport system component
MEEWTLQVADFINDEGGPRLENIQSYQPLGPVFYESHGFSPDGSRILFTAFIQPDEANQAWMDIYTLELATGALTRLTDSPDVWDEHAHYTPDGSRIVWSSSTDCQCDPSRLRTLQMDLWLMQADGANKHRLTGLVASGADRNLAIDNSWGPDGRQIAVLLVDGNAPGRGSIALVTLP